MTIEEQAQEEALGITVVNEKMVVTYEQCNWWCELIRWVEELFGWL